MSFILAKNEPVHAGCRRVALEEFDAVLAHLRAGRESPAALHEGRKALKRLRALLALARPMVGEGTAALDRRLRDAGRRLARHRETDALVELLDEETRAVSCRELGLLRAAVLLHHEASLPLGASGDRGREIELARRAVAAAKRRFACIDIEATTTGTLRRRLRNAYRRARRAWREARAVRGTEALHVLRIRVKRLLDQMRLVRAFGVRPLGGERRRLSRLDDMLGRSRDCGALAHVLRGVPPAEAPLGDGYGLRARLEAIAAAQAAAALRLGAALFRRRSRLWVERMLGPERTRR